ncbi:MAG: DUF2007 domain-containing protein [Chryseobacterium sp.]|nr:MAG: DUF2007 domain-containing protein [Chryseobacterium sp.]
MELLTLRTFTGFVDAHLLKTKLESEGFAVYIFDENINTVFPLYNNATGGIKLKVRSEDFDAATQLLKELDDLKYTDDAGERLKCPNCGSEDLFSGFKSFRGAKGFFSMLLSFLMLEYPIYYRTVYRCKNCDFEFENSEEQDSKA